MKEYTKWKYLQNIFTCRGISSNFHSPNNITLSILFINLFMWLHAASKSNNIFFLTISKQPYEKRIYSIKLSTILLWNQSFQRFKSFSFHAFSSILPCLFDRATINFFKLLTLSFFLPWISSSLIFYNSMIIETLQ